MKHPSNNGNRPRLIPRKTGLRKFSDLNKLFFLDSKIISIMNRVKFENFAIPNVDISIPAGFLSPAADYR